MENFRKYVIPIGIFLLIVALIASYPAIKARLPQDACPDGYVTVNGHTGSEKRGLIDDPEVVQILHDDYCKVVVAKNAGSYEMVDGTVDITDDDFVWTANLLGASKYVDVYGKPLAQESIVQSSIVLVAFNYPEAPVADLLVNAGYAEKQGEVYTLDLCKTAPDFMVKPWQEIGVPRASNLYFNLSDAVHSSSGGLYLVLLGTAYNGCQGLTVDNVNTILPTLSRYYQFEYADTQSLSQFKQVLNGSIPVVATYENLPVEYMLANPNDAGKINRLTIINTYPTVWAHHPFLARTQAGLELMQALQDPRIQKIACERHGFRTVDCNTDLWGLKSVAPSVPGSMNLPRYEVFESMIQFFKQTGVITGSNFGSASDINSDINTITNP